jgi:hypothetical protein
LWLQSGIAELQHGADIAMSLVPMTNRQAVP